MIVLDTHAWLWWAHDPERLSRRARSAIARAAAVGMSAISCYEVAALVARGRLRLDREPLAWIEEALDAPRTRLLAPEPEIAACATALGPEVHGDPGDWIIAATAMSRPRP